MADDPLWLTPETEPDPEPDEWIIDDIMPANELHLIAGPSGGNKSTLINQFLVIWQTGGKFFGHQCHPRPFIYISLDRGNGGVKRTLRRCGINPRHFPYLAGVNLKNRPKTLLALLKAILDKYPDLFDITNPNPFAGWVLIIEGIGRLAPSGAKANDYVSTADFATDLTAFCNENKVTAIGVTHSPKTKEGEAYTNPRQRVLGSVAWAAYSETIILSEPHEHDPKRLRRVWLLPRNAAEENYVMQLNERGMLEHYEEPTLPDAKEKSHLDELLDEWLEGLPAGFMFSRAEAVEAGKQRHISDATVDRWLNTCLAGMFIKKLSKGLYQKPEKLDPTPPEPPEEGEPPSDTGGIA